MSPPHVNVLKSNNAQDTHRPGGNGTILSSHIASSLGATDGDTTKRTAYQMLEPNKPAEHTEFLSGSPIIHAAIAGKKLTNKKKDRVADSQHMSFMYGSQESNMKG